MDFFKNTVYVRVRPDRLSVVHVESGNAFSDAPILAIGNRNGKRTVLAVGAENTAQANHGNVVLANGFDHPRTIIADFTIAEQTLNYFLKRVLPKSLFTVSPIIVIHPQTKLEGGLTQIEIRALAELGLGAGARKVYVWEGAELTGETLRELDFAHAAGTLLHPPAVS